LVVNAVVMSARRVATGKPALETSDIAFRNWAVNWSTDQETERREGKERRIVDPRALIEALRE
jgi:hypothetical protein